MKPPRTLGDGRCECIEFRSNQPTYGAKVPLGIEHVIEKFVGKYMATSATIYLAAGLDDFARKLDGGVPLRVADVAVRSENGFIGR